jgi:hypothetical protein
MSIRTSIYDFFAYTIPGGLLLLAILVGLELFGLTDLWTQFYKSNFSQILILILSSYVMGHITSTINSRWVKFFESRSIPTLALTEFKAFHPTIEVDINPDDWQIWFASIRRESLELTLEVDRLMATSYLMRGVSSFFALSFLIILSAVVFGKLLWWFIFLLPVMAIFSFISVKQSIKFNKWFYFLIFELIVSRKEPFHFSKKEGTKEQKANEL